MLIWAVLAGLMAVPVAAAARSPLLVWRDAIYVVAGFAGIVAMALMVVQPLLAAGYLPGVTGRGSRRLHMQVGALMVLSVLVHVGGLWITSPPDVIDALLFDSPTPFSVWGVLAMWALFAAALLALVRRRIRWLAWRIWHAGLALAVVFGTVLHSVLVVGTMETYSKLMLCIAILTLTLKVVLDRRGRLMRRGR